MNLNIGQKLGKIGQTFKTIWKVGQNWDLNKIDNLTKLKDH